MQLDTSKWREVVVTYEDATFTFAPLGLGARMDLESVVSEIIAGNPLAETGVFHFHDLSAPARRQVVETIRDHLTGWDGVRDEKGGQIVFAKSFVDMLEPSIAIALFFRLYESSVISEDERKNLSTQSRLAEPATTSIAEDATPPEPTRAENPADSSTEGATATG